MSIPAHCPSCQATFNVDDQHAGKRGRCPRCKATIQIPTREVDEGELVPIDDPAPTRRPPTPTPAPDLDDSESYSLIASATKARVVAARGGAGLARGEAARGVLRATGASRATQTPAQILAAFRGEIEPVRATPLYLFWLAVVSGVMILLPVVYLGIVGLIIYALSVHAYHDASWLKDVQNTRAAVLLYFAPLVAGGVAVAFMLKPLFARSSKRGDVRALDPDVEPLLFAFVDGVCSTVGAPRPSRIEVSSSVNASAHLDGAVPVLGRELVLTIGLPLAAGLTLNQFAGVLAHEFGHFSQGAGMRLSYLIWSINAWFARIVYERDEWDQTLVNWSTSGNGSLMALALVARSAVWATRRILWTLMYLGHLVSGFLSREMEYDADRYMARMVGGPVFARVLWRLQELTLAENGAWADIASSWQEQRLPDNLPKLVVANVPQLPRDLLAAHRKVMGQRETGLFDTHPADKDRIARARAEADEGIFHLEGPATDLFRGFDSLARVATFDHYRAILGPQVAKSQLFPVADFVQAQAVTHEGHEALDRIFLNAYAPLQSLPLDWDYPRPHADPAAARKAVVHARQDMQAARQKNLDALKLGNELHEKAVTAETALALLKAGHKLKASDFDLRKATVGDAEAARDSAEAARRHLSTQLDAFGEAAARRLRAALAILEVDAVANAIPDGPARRDEARALYTCVAHLASRVVNEMPPLIRDQKVLGRLVNAFQQGNNQQNQPLINALLRAGKQLRDHLEEFRWKVGDTIIYPFDHAREDASLARYALPLVPDKDAVGDLWQASDVAVDRLVALYRRALGRLALTTEEVELALGLSPIPSEKPTEPAVEEDPDD